MAVPAKPGFVTHTQRDGSQITVQLMGDEFFPYFGTQDGMPVMNDDNLQITEVNATLTGEHVKERSAKLPRFIVVRYDQVERHLCITTDTRPFTPLLMLRRWMKSVYVIILSTLW